MHIIFLSGSINYQMLKIDDIFSIPIEINHAKSVKQAISLVQTQQWLFTNTFLFLDADVSIAETCQELRGNPLTAVSPIIAIISDSAERDIALQSGADDYLLLPFSPIEMRSRLLPYLGQEYDLPLQIFTQCAGRGKRGHFVCSGVD